MEIIQIPGYTRLEKLEIAKRYLLPRQIQENGLTSSNIRFSDAALEHVIGDYTAESGVRSLERTIGRVCRKVARQIARARRPKRVNVRSRPSSATTLRLSASSICRYASAASSVRCARSVDARRRLGFVAASMGLYARLSAKEFIEYFGRLHGLQGGELEGRIESNGPGKNVLIRNKFVREDTGTHETLTILDDSIVDSGEEAGIDPYNKLIDRNSDDNLKAL